MIQASILNHSDKEIMHDCPACKGISERVICFFNDDLKIHRGQLFLFIVKTNGRCVACFMEDNLPDQILIKNVANRISWIISFMVSPTNKKSAARLLTALRGRKDNFAVWRINKSWVKSKDLSDP